MPPSTAPKIDPQFFTMSDAICRDPERRRVLNYVLDVNAKSSVGHMFYPESLQLLTMKCRQPERFCSFAPCLASQHCTVHMQTRIKNRYETLEDLKLAFTVPAERKTKALGPMSNDEAYSLIAKTSGGNLTRQQVFDLMKRKAKDPLQFCKEVACVQIAPCELHMMGTVGDIARLLKLPR